MQTQNNVSDRVHSIERMENKRATFHVYYQRNAKKFFEPSWAKTAEDARTDYIAFFKELRMKNCEILKIVPCNPNITL